MNNSITAIPGFRVGHYTDLTGITGCTVILCPEGAMGGVDVRGGAPGTRETDLLHPDCMVDKVHAILLGGGSAFGLAAADGVMRWLEERGHGFDVGVARVPIVPAAILFDLPIGDPKRRPDAAAGYAACEAATTEPVIEGSVGAGTGACVGKLFGLAGSTKGGVGSAQITFADGVIVAALVAVNAFGDVRNPDTGAIIAGAHKPGSPDFADTVQTLMAMGTGDFRRFAARNTTIGVVATNAKLTKTETNKMAQMAHNGFARAISPVHTMGDGDVIFALSHGDKVSNVNLLGELAARAMSAAIVNAVSAATALGGVPAMRDLAALRT